MDERRSTGIRDLLVGIAERALRSWQDLSGHAPVPATVARGRSEVVAEAGRPVGHAA
jgi:hypothetical protein